MFIYFDEENMPDEKTVEYMNKATELALYLEGIKSDNISLSVSFADKDEIHSLNKQYRNVDKETDVLSFPAFESGQIPESDEDEEIAIGDVVICTDVAKAQAEEYGHSYERELIYLFVHSLFHLLGYDHEDEEEKIMMREREESVMILLGLGR